MNACDLARQKHCRYLIGFSSSASVFYLTLLRVMLSSLPALLISTPSWLLEKVHSFFIYLLLQIPILSFHVSNISYAKIIYVDAGVYLPNLCVNPRRAMYQTRSNGDAAPATIWWCRCRLGSDGHLIPSLE